MSEELYRIGAVAKRTGITPECLRAWERRYGLEPADRAGRTRFYNLAQVERLCAIKSLLDQGHPISTLIHLSSEELQRRSRRAAPAPVAGDADSGCRAGLVGGALVQAYRAAAGETGLEVVGEWASLGDLEAERHSLPALDCLIVYLSTLDPERVEAAARRFPAAHLVVVFRYATAADLAQLRGDERPLVRWPTDWIGLERIATAGLARRGRAGRFSEEELLHVGLMAARAGCDCPRHLVDLVTAVADYAAHLARCRRDEAHGRMAVEVDAARARLEDALALLVRQHGLLATAN